MVASCPKFGAICLRFYEGRLVLGRFVQIPIREIIGCLPEIKVLPVGMRDDVEMGLDHLVICNIIAPVTEPTSWIALTT